MASIMDLLKSNKKDIYGNNGLIYIESRGIVNPPRALALAASSPTAVADMIGNAVAGVAGGSAKRPSDTIYKNITPFSKPISLAAPTEALLKASIEGSGDPSVSSTTPYFVKTSPNPGSNLYNNIKNAVASPGGAQSSAITALNKYGSKDGIQKLKDFRNQLKNPAESDTYGAKWTYAGNDARKPKTEDIKYSTHYKSSDGKLKKREVTKFANGKSSWDQINYELLTSAGVRDDKLNEFKKTNQLHEVPHVLFQLYGKTNENILLPGTVTGVSEDYAPEVNAFKFIGSPFNLYRYGGVERTLKFDIKLYSVDSLTQKAMNKNLNLLRKLVFPDENITAIIYPNSEKNSPLAFNPNLVYLTINGLYDKILGIIDSLSISIDDNVSWSGISNSGGEASKYIKPQPSIYNVSIGMRIIEYPSVKTKSEWVSIDDFKDAQKITAANFVYGESNDTKNQYVNYFTGLNEDGLNKDEKNNKNEDITKITQDLVKASFFKF